MGRTWSGVSGSLGGSRSNLQSKFPGVVPRTARHACCQRGCKQAQQLLAPKQPLQPYSDSRCGSGHMKNAITFASIYKIDTSSCTPQLQMQAACENKKKHDHILKPDAEGVWDGWFLFGGFLFLFLFLFSDSIYWKESSSQY